MHEVTWQIFTIYRIFHTEPWKQHCANGHTAVESGSDWLTHSAYRPRFLAHSPSGNRGNDWHRNCFNGERPEVWAD